MRRVEWLVRATLVFCLLYVAVASQTRTSERFPLFGWDLFSRVPNPRPSDYTARIIAADGLQTPVNFEDADLLSAAVDWKQVDADDANSCGIRAGNRLFCWGSGLIGDGTTNEYLVPTESSLGGWTSISIGQTFRVGTRIPT